MPDLPDKMSLESMDVAEDRRRRLKEAFPEAFSEGKVDFDQLRRSLGEWVEPPLERFGLNWPGKAECMRAIQAPAKGTLKPRKGESVNWDASENLFIEGDNLEVLKLLQKPYYGKIKMIYIDPPYNTGKEFIYSDNYTDGLDAYLRYTGQKDGNGRRLSTNADTSGRLDSKWLNMMYTRLYLARNLLREDGVIFISIDDNEHAHLKKMCDEIFGEENTVGTIGWESKTKTQNTKDSFNKLQPKIEYVLCYGKQDKRRFNLYPNGEKKYPETDEKGRFRYQQVEQMNASGVRGRESMVFPILGVSPQSGKQWQLGANTIKNFIARGDVLIKKGKIFLKMREGDERTETTKPFWAFFPKEDGTAETAKKELTSLFGSDDHGFETVKPINIIKKLIFHSTKENDIILDFFSGSSTTAHAVMASNAEYGGSRSFIMVQLPEPLGKHSQKHRTIADIGKARIRLAGKEITTQKQKTNFLDIGFKCLKLDKSCFKEWDDSPDIDEPTLIKRMEGQVDYLDPDASTDDILHELMLKNGLPPTATVKTLVIQGKKVHSMKNGALLLCLDKNLTEEFILELSKIEPVPEKVVCLDAGFNDDDELKANSVEAFKITSHHKETVIQFLTV